MESEAFKDGFYSGPKDEYKISVVMSEGAYSAS